MSEDLFSVLAAIGIIALVYRWFKTSPISSPNASSQTATITALQRRAINLPRAQVDRLLTMFPQLTENEVRYALVVTRGGVEAVAERVLIRGGLDPPPPNFFPPTPTPPSTTQTQSNLTAPNISTTLLPNVIKPNHSMISKLCLEPYKLEQDLAFRENRDWKWEDCLPEMAKSYLTSSTTENSSLKERKAKMVLESRWRVLQNDKKGKTVI